jgi:tetratricopeptide (TPR) repeat protein
LNPNLSPEEWRLVNGTTRSTLASVLADQGKFDEAFRTSQEAVTECRDREKAETPDYGFALTILGGFLTERGQFNQADKVLAEAEAILRRFFSSSSLWIGDNLRNQGDSLYRQGKYDRALQCVEEALQIYRESFGTHYDHYPTALIIQGLSLVKTGHTNEGEQVLRDALKLRVDSLPNDHPWIAIAKGALGECLLIEKRYAEAEPLLLASYAKLKSFHGDNHPRTQLVRQHLIRLYENSGFPGKAQQYRNESAAAPTG